MTVSDPLTWLAVHHAQIVEYIGTGCGILYTIIQVALRFAPLTSWVTLAERSPRVAAFVRILGTLGVQIVPLAQAIIDLIRGEASPGTKASAVALQVSSSKPLIAAPAPKGPTS